MNRSFARSVTLGLALVSALFVASTASAAPGDLDRSFGKNGRVVLHLGEKSRATSAVLQTDGRIVIGGTIGDGNPQKGFLARLTPDGKLDRTFGANGIARLGIASGVELSAATDGTIYAIAAEVWPASSIYALSRDGQTVNGFGGDGKLAFEELIPDHVAANIAAQGDKLLVTGTRFNSGDITGDMVLARITAIGALDPGFGSSGVVNGSVGSSYVWYGPPVAVYGDGSIIVGIGSPATTLGPVITKLGRDGAADGSFRYSPTLGFTGPGSDFQLATTSSGGVVVTSRYTSWNKGTTTWLNAHVFDRTGKELPKGFSEVWGSSPVLLSGDSFAAVGNNADAIAGGRMSISLRNPDGSTPVNRSYAVGLGSSSGAAVALPGRDLLVVGQTCDGYCDVAVVKVLTTDQGDPVVSPELKFPESGSYRRGKLKIRHVSGRVRSTAGVKRVDVAILRTNTPGADSGYCSWMEKNRRTFIRRPATKAGNCTKPIVMRAKGRTKWWLQLRRPLPLGTYEIRVRVQLKNGSFSPWRRDADAFSEIEVWQNNAK